MLNGFCWQRITSESWVLLLRRHELNPTSPGLCVCPNAPSPPASQRSAPGSQGPRFPRAQKTADSPTPKPANRSAIGPVGVRGNAVGQRGLTPKETHSKRITDQPEVPWHLRVANRLRLSAIPSPSPPPPPILDAPTRRHTSCVGRPTQCARVPLQRCSRRCLVLAGCVPLLHSPALSSDLVACCRPSAATPNRPSWILPPVSRRGDRRNWRNWRH